MISIHFLLLRCAFDRETSERTWLQIPRSVSTLRKASLIHVILQICLMLIAAAFAAEEKAVKKRGLYGLGYGLGGGYGGHGGLSGYGGYSGYSGYGGHGVTVAVAEKPVPITIAVPHPVPVPVDRPYPVKVSVFPDT
jgi:hypothetical protein